VSNGVAAVFNFFFRPYAPGFRVRPHDDLLGFNFSETDLVRGASSWSDGMIADAMTRRYPSAAQAKTSGSIGFPTPEGVIQSAHPIGLSGFRVSPQDDVPGFNVGPSDDTLGFNLNEGGMLSPPPGVEEPAEPTTPHLPEWLYKVATILPQLTTLDPLTGRRVAINSLPGISSVTPPDTARSASSSVPQQPTGPGIGSRSVITWGTTSQPPLGEATSSVWRRPQASARAYTQATKLDSPLSAEIMRKPEGLPAMMAAEPVTGANFILASDRAAYEQPSRPLEYQQRQLLAPNGTAIAEANQPRKLDMHTAPLERDPEWMPAPFRGVDRPPLKVEGSVEALRPIEQTHIRVEKPQVAPRADLFRRDAAGLPIGTILSGIRFADSTGGGAISSVESSLDPTRRQASVGTIAPHDLNVQLVGDGNSLEDVPRDKRHLRGVEASISDHLAKGFELVARGPRAVDVPGFSSPRLYDYIIRDPVTGLCYGVEVKTTIMSTIRLDRQQVMKDAVVVAQRAKVRALDVDLYGVSYSVYCFGCEALDVRSAVLLSILQNAGVPVVPGVLPGDIRP
jgi:hypothetical protein